MLVQPAAVVRGHTDSDPALESDEAEAMEVEEDGEKAEGQQEEVVEPCETVSPSRRQTPVPFGSLLEKPR